MEHLEYARPRPQCYTMYHNDLLFAVWAAGACAGQHHSRIDAASHLLTPPGGVAAHVPEPSPRIVAGAAVHRIKVGQPYTAA